MVHSEHEPLRIIWLIVLSVLGLMLFAVRGASAQSGRVDTQVVTQAADDAAVQKSAAQSVDDALGQRLSRIMGGVVPAHADGRLGGRP